MVAAKGFGVDIPTLNWKGLNIIFVSGVAGSFYVSGGLAAVSTTATNDATAGHNGTDKMNKNTTKNITPLGTNADDSKAKIILQLQKINTHTVWLISNRLFKWVFATLYFNSFPRPFDQFCAAHFRGRQHVVGAEIGTFRGNHAKSICRYVKPTKLFCVDPYRAFDEWSDRSGLLAAAKRSAKRRLARYPVEFVECLSTSAPVKKLDFAYIDGAHDYDSVRADLNYYWPQINPGGVMGGHDFSTRFEGKYNRVVEAVVAFVSENRLKLFVDGTDWWILKP